MTILFPFSDYNSGANGTTSWLNFIDELDSFEFWKEMQQGGKSRQSGNQRNEKQSSA